MLLLLVIPFSFLPALRAAETNLRTSQIILRLDGNDIHTEVFEPSHPPTRAGIIVLHGAGGTLFDGPGMRRVARALAADGNAVYLVHYFDRTGTLFALDSTMQKNFTSWLTTVREAITAIHARRGDHEPIGIYGYSLGAFQALAAASDNPQVGAVVEQAGGVWNNRMERIGKMPAVLMIHGREDRRVPFAKYAQPLIPVLRRRAALLETRIFSGEGHGFSPGAMLEVRTEAARFFRHHLASARGRGHSLGERMLPARLPGRT